MSTWGIGQIRVKEPARYKEYAAQFMAILNQYGGALVCIGDVADVLEGQWEYPRTVVIKFPDKNSALRWYHSPEYQKIASIRKSAADANIVLVDSLV